MAKVIDITDKLNLEERPKIKIQKEVIEVNNDAATAMKILQLVNYDLSNGIANEKAFKIACLLFGDKAMEKIQKLRLDFKDFGTLIYAALDTVFDSDEDDEGEAETHTTT